MTTEDRPEMMAKMPHILGAALLTITTPVGADSSSDALVRCIEVSTTSVGTCYRAAEEARNRANERSAAAAARVSAQRLNETAQTEAATSADIQKIFQESAAICQSAVRDCKTACQGDNAGISGACDERMGDTSNQLMNGAQENARAHGGSQTTANHSAADVSMSSGSTQFSAVAATARSVGADTGESPFQPSEGETILQRPVAAAENSSSGNTISRILQVHQPHLLGASQSNGGTAALAPPSVNSKSVEAFRALVNPAGPNSRSWAGARYSYIGVNSSRGLGGDTLNQSTTVAVRGLASETLRSAGNGEAVFQDGITSAYGLSIFEKVSRQYRLQAPRLEK